MVGTNSMSFSFTDSEMPVRFGRYMLVRRLTTDAIGEHFLALWGVDEGYDQLRIVRAIYPAVARDADFVALFSEEARSEERRVGKECLPLCSPRRRPHR